MIRKCDLIVNKTDVPTVAHYEEWGELCGGRDS
jgi:hypothetical protein